MEPDSYYVAVEMQDYYSDNVGAFRDTVDVEPYGFDSLQVSDIQLAANIERVDPEADITRDNLTIEPVPSRFYRAAQPVFIYYEIYNLFLDSDPGNSDYTVEYSIQYAGEETYSIMEYIRSVFVNERLYEGITTKFTTRGTRREEHSFLRIDHTLEKPGPYLLTLKITDNIAKSITEKSTVFRLF